MAIMARRTATRSVRTRRRASTACQSPNSPSPPCHSTIRNRAPLTHSRAFTKRRDTGHSRHTIRNSKVTTRSPCHSLKATSEPTSRFPRILPSPAARKTCTDTAMFGADRKDRRHSRDYASSERCRSFRSCFSDRQRRCTCAHPPAGATWGAPDPMLLIRGRSRGTLRSWVHVRSCQLASPIVLGWPHQYKMRTSFNDGTLGRLPPAVGALKTPSIFHSRGRKLNTPDWLGQSVDGVLPPPVVLCNTSTKWRWFATHAGLREPPRGASPHDAAFSHKKTSASLAIRSKDACTG